MSFLKKHTEDFYKTLGVSNTATPDQVTKAFRALALKHHPDKNKEDGATEAFQKLNAAYEILKDPAQRSLYDALDYPNIVKEGLRSNVEEMVRNAARTQQAWFTSCQRDHPPQGPFQPGGSRSGSSDKSRAQGQSQQRSGFNSSSYQSQPQGHSQQRSRFGSSYQEPNPGAQTSSPFGSTQPPNAPKKPRHDSSSKRAYYGEEAKSGAPGSKTYIYGDGLKFILSQMMILRGIRELGLQEQHDLSARKESQQVYNALAAELRKNFGFAVCDDVVQSVWRTDPEAMKFRAKQKEAATERKRMYFRNAWPELLTGGKLPKAWESLWEAFGKQTFRGMSAAEHANFGSETPAYSSPYSASHQAPNRPEHSQGGNSREQAKPGGRQETPRFHKAWNDAFPKPDREDSHEPGSKFYDFGFGRSFTLSAAMIERGKKEIWVYETSEQFAWSAARVHFEQFATELRRNMKHVVSDYVIQRMYKEGWEGISYISKRAAESRDRKKGYFKNSFPELLLPDGRLPNAWDSLWDRFAQDFDSKSQDREKDAARKQKMKDHATGNTGGGFGSSSEGKEKMAESAESVQEKFKRGTAEWWEKQKKADEALRKNWEKNNGEKKSWESWDDEDGDSSMGGI